MKEPEQLECNQKLLTAAEFLQIMNKAFGVKEAEYRVLNTLLYYERRLDELNAQTALSARALRDCVGPGGCPACGSSGPGHFVHCTLDQALQGSSGSRSKR